MDLADKLVLVTGSAGGIGLATAIAFAREGARLALMDIDGDRLVAAREEVRAASRKDYQPLALAVDLTDEDAIYAAFYHLREQFGEVDVLINNAGLCVGGSFADTEPLHIDKVVRTNLVAPLRLCHMVIPGMKAKGDGHILNVYSSSATLGVPGFVSYSSSKGGLATATRILRRELNGTGINLTLLCPGSVLTPMSEAMVASGKGPGAIPQSAPETAAAAIVDAVKANRRLVMVSQNPIMQGLVMCLDRIFPGMLDKYWIKKADAEYYEGAAAIGKRV